MANPGRCRDRHCECELGWLANLDCPITTFSVERAIAICELECTCAHTERDLLAWPLDSGERLKLLPGRPGTAGRRRLQEQEHRCGCRLMLLGRRYVEGEVAASSCATLAASLLVGPGVVGEAEAERINDEGLVHEPVSPPRVRYVEPGVEDLATTCSARPHAHVRDGGRLDKVPSVEGLWQPACGRDVAEKDVCHGGAAHLPRVAHPEDRTDAFVVLVLEQVQWPTADDDQYHRHVPRGRLVNQLRLAIRPRDVVPVAALCLQAVVLANERLRRVKVGIRDMLVVTKYASDYHHHISIRPHHLGVRVRAHLGSAGGHHNTGASIKQALQGGDDDPILERECIIVPEKTDRRISQWPEKGDLLRPFQRQRLFCILQKHNRLLRCLTCQ
mmetsp:Transcript_146874/g.471540  ORF Transcript_146874/g.471540 Transcript_146874/m.471540 type:complete len:388 (-) Transcript_146874:1296-2459(-)